LIAQLNDGTYSKNQVLSAQGIATLHSAGAQVGPSISYGMGWVIHDQLGLAKFEHNGDVSNFHSNMLLLPEEQIGVVILINVSGLNNAAVINIPIEGVAAILLGHSLPPSVDPPIDLITPALPLIPVWRSGGQFQVQLPFAPRVLAFPLAAARSLPSSLSLIAAESAIIADLYRRGDGIEAIVLDADPQTPATISSGDRSRVLSPASLTVTPLDVGLP